MRRIVCKLLLPCCLLQEPARLRWLYFEFESPVREGSQFDFHGHVSADVGCSLVELLAKLHHVYS